MAANPAPHLTHSHLPLVGALYAELSSETRGRGRFATASETDLHNAAGIIVRYRLGPLTTVRPTGRGARRMFLSDMRELGRRPYPEMHLTMQLLAHFTTQIAKACPNANDPPFEEAVSHQRLLGCTANLSHLGPDQMPNQLMANYISLGLARGKDQIPSYTPFISPDITASPWPAPTAEHTAAVARWANGRQSVKSPKTQQLPLGAWSLYRRRYIFTADYLSAWPSFGGIAAQFNHLSIALHLATTESVATDWISDSILRAHLAELARSRDAMNPGAPYFTEDFDSLLSNEQPRFKLQASAQTAKVSPPPKAPPLRTR